MAKIKYVARLNGQIVGTRTSAERIYTHAIVINGHDKTDHVVTWCGRLDLAQGEQRKYARYGYRAEIVPAERLEPKAKPAAKVDAIAAPAPAEPEAPAAEAAPELNAQQQRTVDRIRALIIKNKSCGDAARREFKQFKLTGGGSTGLVFLVTEYGAIGDEATMASLICRDRRMFQIGRRGCVRLLSLHSTLRTSTPKNVRGAFNVVNFYHLEKKPARAAKAKAAPAATAEPIVEAAAPAPSSSGYPVPFQFTIAPGTPLLVMSCSSTKRATAAGELVRFADLYDGPTWRQVKASAFPLSNVAAISALHGFLEPGIAIETYDREMDEKISARICGTSCHAARLEAAIRQAGSAFIVGGGLYRELAQTVLRMAPDLAGVVTFATGSYLAQRKQLGAWLRDQAAIAATADLEAAELDAELQAEAAELEAKTETPAQLKANLDRGALIKVGNRDGLPLAEAFARDGRYQFRGLTGRHSIDCSCSDAERLAAHWETFVQANVDYADRLDREAAAAAKPDLCYAVIPAGPGQAEIGIIKRGEAGYNSTDYGTGSIEIVRGQVDHLNAQLGVDRIEARAMVCGSMFGWDVPAANSDHQRDAIAEADAIAAAGEVAA